MFSIKILGLQELVRHFDDVKSKVARTLAESMSEAAFFVERTAKIELTQGPNRAIKTGYLRASVVVSSLLPFRATVVAGAYYGIYVHEGTRYMRARPFMNDALRKSVPTIEKIFGRRVQTMLEFI